MINDCFPVVIFLPLGVGATEWPDPSLLKGYDLSNWLSIFFFFFFFFYSFVICDLLTGL
jgi:hypothetical protein